MKIIEFWRTMPLLKPPFIHPEDLPAINKYDADLLAVPFTSCPQRV
jgi:hypothetical protein